VADTRSVLVVGAVVGIGAFAMGRVTAPETPPGVVAEPSASPTPSGPNPLDLLTTLALVGSYRPSGGYYYLQRLLGASYGRGLGDACDQLGASKADCAKAYVEAAGLCGSNEIVQVCPPPVPGYFYIPNGISKRLRTTYDDRVQAPGEGHLCEHSLDHGDSVPSPRCEQVVHGFLLTFPA
jgi:hypothetical protein